MAKIVEYEDQIYHCTRCGLCQAVCPVYDVMKNEMAVSRGKIALMQAVLSGELEFTPVVAKYMELCTGCGACEETCPSGVSTEKIFLAAKEFVANKYGLTLPKKAIVNSFSSTKALNFFSTLLNIYSMVKAGHIVDHMPGTFPFIDKLKLLNSQLDGKVSFNLNKLHIKQEKPAYKLLYFPGCINKYVNPSVAHSAIEILKENNCEIYIPDGFLCCGMPARNSGAIELAQKLALENIELFTDKNTFEYDYIVVDCASCGAMLKSYKDLFAEIPEIAAKCEDLKDKIIDINVLLTKLDLNILHKNTEAITVTYHDPCHLKRSQGVYKEPRALINKIEGVQLIEMKKSDTCCGAAGSFCITHMNLSESISLNKANNILDTGAEIVLTSCPSCKVGIAQGLVLKDKVLKIYHPVELIYELVYKKK